MIGFALRLGQQKFKAAFTAAEGCGTFRQKQAKDSLEAALDLKYGTVKLVTIRLALPVGITAKFAKVQLGRRSPDHTVTVKDGTAIVTLQEPVVVPVGQTLSIVVK